MNTNAPPAPPLPFQLPYSIPMRVGSPVVAMVPNWHAMSPVEITVKARSPFVGHTLKFIRDTHEAMRESLAVSERVMLTSIAQQGAEIDSVCQQFEKERETAIAADAKAAEVKKEREEADKTIENLQLELQSTLKTSDYDKLKAQMGSFRTDLAKANSGWQASQKENTDLKKQLAMVKFDLDQEKQEKAELTAKYAELQEAYEKLRAFQ